MAKKIGLVLSMIFALGYLYGPMALAKDTYKITEVVHGGTETLSGKSRKGAFATSNPRFTISKYPIGDQRFTI